MSSAPDSSRPGPIPQTKRCPVCGYDLRGSDSAHCSECGAARQLEGISIPDRPQYHQARAALEHEGLLIKAMDPSETWLLVQTGLQRPGWLWVDRSQLDRAEEILDQLGIPNSINARPIVDRAEPQCPRCNKSLDPRGPEQCPHCGMLFTWVEIDDVSESDVP